MKRITSLFVFLTTCSLAFSQPKLTSDEMLPFGSVMRFKYIQNTYDIDTTIQGENATWDFSGIINASRPELGITVADPAKTPRGASFTDANYAWVESPTAYRYFNLNSERMQRVGSYTTSVNTFTDPQIELVFPLTYGTTSFDTWNNTNSSFGGGTYDFKCIGYGKLTTPGGTFNDALLVRVIMSEGELYTFPMYFWYDADNGATLLTYTPGDGFFIGAYGMYMSSLNNTSVSEAGNAWNIRYNNPVNEVLHVTLENKQNEVNNYTVYNMLGQAILSGKDASAQLNIDVSKLSSGTYFLSLQNNAKASTRIKFIKQ